VNWQHSNRSKTDYSRAPKKIQKAFDKQAHLLAVNLLHPSLHAKKYGEANGQARVNRNWRFYFKIEDDAYIIAAIVPHPK
jgi:hypothetical protein